MCTSVSITDVENLNQMRTIIFFVLFFRNKKFSAFFLSLVLLLPLYLKIINGKLTNFSTWKSVFLSFIIFSIEVQQEVSLEIFFLRFPFFMSKLSQLQFFREMTNAWQDPRGNYYITFTIFFSNRAEPKEFIFEWMNAVQKKK